MSKSKIEWTERTWNPISGCTKVSEGCANCYAETMAKRLQAMGAKGYENGFAVTLHPGKLYEPLNIKKPSMFFVCSMGDLFHEDVPFEFIKEIFLVMGYTENQHTYQILTKRPERMREFIFWFMGQIPAIEGRKERFAIWAKNIWLGVTAENQEQADKRIPILLYTPAAVRFVSIEPMLENIDLPLLLGAKMKCPRCNYIAPTESFAPGFTTEDGQCPHCGVKGLVEKFGNTIDWVIVGGETGPKARPINPKWVQSLQTQCKNAMDGEVPFFFKQWGEWIDLPFGKRMTGFKTHRWEDGSQSVRIGKTRAGHLLDGKEYRQMPEAKK